MIQTALKVTGIDHVVMHVRDLPRERRFYTEVLGLSRRIDRPELGVQGAWLDAGDQQVHLIQGEPPPGRGQHFALLVDDLDGVVVDLRSGGQKVSDPSPVGKSRQAFLSDPAGNLIELHQAGR